MYGKLLFSVWVGCIRRTAELKRSGDCRAGGYDTASFLKFEIAFDDQALNIAVDSIKTRVAVQEMPFVFSAGRILIQTYMCRVGVRNLEVRLSS
jgi:hypothetical protein